MNKLRYAWIGVMSFAVCFSVRADVNFTNDSDNSVQHYVGHSHTEISHQWGVSTQHTVGIAYGYYPTTGCDSSPWSVDYESYQPYDAWTNNSNAAAGGWQTVDPHQGIYDQDTVSDTQDEPISNYGDVDASDSEMFTNYDPLDTYDYYVITEATTSWYAEMNTWTFTSDSYWD